MSFDREAESDEVEFHIELIFKSGKPHQKHSLPMSPSAYIAMGSFSSDAKGRPMITSEEMSHEALKAQVEHIKAALDARVAEANARFAAAKSV
jgi:hypothetical protein